MRILQIITSLRTGGAERLVVGLIDRLRRMGHEADLLVMDGTETLFTKDARNRSIKVNYLSKGFSAMYNPLLVMRMRRFIKEGNYDVVHTHNFPCQLLGAVATPKDVTLITTEHNTDNRRRGNPLWRFVDKAMYGRYDSIIACSKDVAASLMAYMPELSSKITTVENGIDLQHFSSAMAASDIALRFKNCKIIVMVAAFRPQKDQATLLKAVSLLPDDYVLVLAGEGETLETHRQMANELGIDERVLFTGARSDVAELYAVADVAVLSTHYEGLPLSAVEAMASGTPLIVSDAPGLRNIVGQAAILFPVEDAEVLAERIKALCTDDRLRQLTIEACLRRAAIFDIENTAKGYNDVYCKTL